MQKKSGLFTFFAAKKSVPAKPNKNNVLIGDTQVKMGTFANMQCLCESADLAKECIARAFLRIDELEKIFSRHSSSSLLSVLNSQGSVQDFPSEFKAVLEQSLLIEKQTYGAFNSSVLSVLKYLEEHDRVNARELQEQFARIIHAPVVVQDKKISLKQSESIVTLDAIAKGFIVDCAAQVFEQSGVQNYLINAGGDIRVKGMKSLEKGQEKTWRIAIEDPYKQGNYPAVFSLMRGALATSGNYEKNFGENRHHIILPSLESHQASAFDGQNRQGDLTGTGQTDRGEQFGVSGQANGAGLSLAGNSEHTSPTVKSVSVIAPNAMQADAFATAISCMPVNIALDYINNHAELACMIIAGDDSVHKSKNWIIR